MSRRTLHLMWQYDPHSPGIWERDWLTGLLGAFDVKHVVDLEHETVAHPAIVVTTGQPRRGGDVASYLERFRSGGRPAGVIHLSDEHGRAPLDFYRHAAFVYRNYLRRDAPNGPRCRYFALGYKTGFTEGLVRRDIGSRRYTWSFAGHLKTSRKEMLRTARRIPGGFEHLTRRFADPEALGVRAYADLLNDTVFALCPRGNASVDCFRVYEALEAGAIPIVEDDGGPGLWRDLLRIRWPGPWLRLARRSFAGSYWHAAYGADFPCPRIHDWRTLPRRLERIDALATARLVRDWWDEYKRRLTREVTQTVGETLFGDAVGHEGSQ